MSAAAIIMMFYGRKQDAEHPQKEIYPCSPQASPQATIELSIDLLDNIISFLR